MPFEDIPVEYVKFQGWENAHGTEKRDNIYTFKPNNGQQTWRKGLKDLKAIVRYVQSYDTIPELRAYGGSWSLSEAAAVRKYEQTFLDGGMVDTSHLDRVIRTGLESTFVRSDYAAQRSDDLGGDAPNEHLVLVQSGTTVEDLNRILGDSDPPRSLKTTGASDGQSICGAVQTGTHGGAYDVGSMHDSVVGLHIVGENGEDHWIERESNPVVTDDFLDWFEGRLHRDDNLFESALVGIGAFGLVHAMLIETEPLFDLAVWRWKCAFDHAAREAIEAIVNRDETSWVNAVTNFPGASPPDELPYHFEVNFNVYAADDDAQCAYMTAMYKRTDHRVPVGDFDAKQPEVGSCIYEMISKAPDLLDSIRRNPPGDLIANAVKNVVLSKRQTYHGERGTLAQVFGTPALPNTDGCSTEFALPAEHALDAVELVREVARGDTFLGVMGLRFVKSTSAPLAHTSFDGTDLACTIELPAVQSNETIAFYDNLWDALDREPYPYKFHLGQQNNLTRRRARTLFGVGRLRRWADARRQLLSPAGRRLFTNSLVAKFA